MPDVIDAYVALPKNSIPLSVIENEGIDINNLVIASSPMFSKSYLSWIGTVSEEIKVYIKEYTYVEVYDPRNLLPQPFSTDGTTPTNWSITGTYNYKKLNITTNDAYRLFDHPTYLIGGGSTAEDYQLSKQRVSTTGSVSLSSNPVTINNSINYTLIGYFLIESVVATGTTVPGAHNSAYIEATVKLMDSSNNVVAQEMFAVRNRYPDDPNGEFGYLRESLWWVTYFSDISTGNKGIPYVTTNYVWAPLSVVPGVAPAFRRIVFGAIKNIPSNVTKAAVDLAINGASGLRITLVSLHLVPLRSAWNYAKHRTPALNMEPYQLNLLQVALGKRLPLTIGGTSGSQLPANANGITHYTPLHNYYWDSRCWSILHNYDNRSRFVYLIALADYYSRPVWKNHPGITALQNDRYHVSTMCTSGVPSNFNGYLPTSYPVMRCNGLSVSRELQVSRWPGAIPLQVGWYSDPVPVEVGALYSLAVVVNALDNRPTPSWLDSFKDASGVARNQCGGLISFNADTVLVVVEGIDRNGKVVELAFSSPIPQLTNRYQDWRNPSKPSHLFVDGAQILTVPNANFPDLYIRFQNPSVVAARVGLKVFQVYGIPEYGNYGNKIPYFVPPPLGTLHFGLLQFSLEKHAEGTTTDVLSDPEITGTWLVGAEAWSVNSDTGKYTLTNPRTIRHGGHSTGGEAPGRNGYLYSKPIGGRTPGSYLTFSASDLYTRKGEYAQVVLQLRALVESDANITRSSAVVALYGGTTDANRVEVYRDTARLTHILNKNRGQWVDISVPLCYIDYKALEGTLGNASSWALQIEVSLDCSKTSEGAVRVGYAQVSLVSPSEIVPQITTVESVVGEQAKDVLDIKRNPVVVGVLEDRNGDWSLYLQPGVIYREYTVSSSLPSSKFPRPFIQPGQKANLVYTIPSYSRGAIVEADGVRIPTTRVIERVRPFGKSISTSYPIASVVGVRFGNTSITGTNYRRFSNRIELPESAVGYGELQVEYDAYFPYEIYTGFRHYWEDSSGVKSKWVPLSINIRTGCRVGALNEYLHTVGIYEDPYVLTQYGVTLYLLPYAAIAEDGQFYINPLARYGSDCFLRHKLGVETGERLSADDTTLVVTRVLFPAMNSVGMIRAIDVRRRGGGIRDVSILERKLRSLFWDISSLDSASGAGSVLVRLPAKVLSQDGWGFSDSEVREIIRKYLPAGIVFDVEYY
jgi:hypothetical protein